MNGTKLPHHFCGFKAKKKNQQQQNNSLYGNENRHSRFFLTLKQFINKNGFLQELAIVCLNCK